MLVTSLTSTAPAETLLPLLLMAGSLAISAAVIILIIAALISILGSQVSGGMKVVWIIFIICAPLIGALLWFFIGRQQVSFSR
ncbi:PLD nuclease N-terminal domain-containing protein [Nocardiopsis ansamitocini]|uniref:Cardiolipin synthase N-terminal domain-containing protein n=1 Tax=Nocardiopsis ansamitocini TaxID=1670832 RepID=A0A9W6UKY5_9ACTN|nr:PLD nuclease N-terminal domain-containing protein [Nocardiopsis ansamitocini]GLU50103.1 hypothetical protein Nans01_44540 [Nocardiopsis ansamitocini]